MTADQIKAIIASYWRYVKQCPVIAMEVSYRLDNYSGDELADVLAVDKSRYLIETEVKISLADLRRDAKKRKHMFFDRGTCVTHHFYFAVPKDIANEAKFVCDELYPYAGILGVDGSGEWGVASYRNPKTLTGKKLSYTQSLRLIFGQSGTVCRLANKVEELNRVQKNLREQLKRYHDMERLEKE
jgi:hypothetical protein